MHTYLKDAKALHDKMSSTIAKAHELDSNILNHHMEAIASKESEIKEATDKPTHDKMEDGHIRPFVDWALNFGHYAHAASNAAQAKAEVEGYTEQEKIHD